MARLKNVSFDLNKHLTQVLHKPPVGPQTEKLDVWTVPSMSAAAATVSRCMLYWPRRGDRKEDFVNASRSAQQGNAHRLATAIEDSESLIAEAIEADSRLARRSQWTRGEEGEVVCPALLSEGDDSPCFYRRRALVGQPNGSEPVKVVISTDAAEIRPRTAAAFIATCRLVQQYRPLEVYWQGSWLSEGRQRGWVFHVPLVTGDMDFARLEYCIADPSRDTLSWSVMMTRAIDDTRASWNGCALQAERSYLPARWDESVNFVSHHGIYPNGESIAAHAADWLGWDSTWKLRWAEAEAIKGALQTVAAPPVEYKAPTAQERAAQEKRWKEYDERRRQQERQEIQARQSQHAGTVTYT